MKKIRIAQIGTSENSHSNSIWNSFIKQSNIFEIVGYAFPENEREKFPKQAKAFEGYREMTVEEILSDPSIEAVAVETEEIYLKTLQEFQNINQEKLKLKENLKERKKILQDLTIF